MFRLQDTYLQFPLSVRLWPPEALFSVFPGFWHAKNSVIRSLNRTKLLMQNYAFPFKFQLVLVDLGSQRKNMALKNFDFVRGRRYRRFKNDDFQIDPSISRDRVIFRLGTYYWIFLALMKAFEWWVERQPIRKFAKNHPKIQPFWTTFLAITAVHKCS